MFFGSLFCGFGLVWLVIFGWLNAALVFRCCFFFVFVIFNIPVSFFISFLIYQFPFFTSPHFTFFYMYFSVHFVCVCLSTLSIYPTILHSVYPSISLYLVPIFLISSHLPLFSCCLRVFFSTFYLSIFQSINLSISLFLSRVYLPTFLPSPSFPPLPPCISSFPSSLRIFSLFLPLFTFLPSLVSRSDSREELGEGLFGGSGVNGSEVCGSVGGGPGGCWSV